MPRRIKKPVVMTEEQRIKALKVKFLEYYKELPILNLAGDYIGRSDDTISRWQREDAEFAEAIDNARAEWTVKNVRKVRSKEWLLERVMRNNFAQRTELTGPNGKELPAPILGGVTIKKDK